MIQRIICPVSGAPAEVIFSRPYSLPEMRRYTELCGLTAKLADKPYEIRYCATSNIHFQTWTMDDSELAGLYSPPADEKTFIEQISQQKLHWFAHMTEEVLMVRQMVSTRKPVVLDFGCNWGKWASMALAFGCETYGLDVNRDAAAFCAARGIKIITQREMGENRFDFINVDQVMEHLTDPLAVAKVIATALKPGGFVKFGTPDNPKLPKLLRAAQASGSNDVLDEKTIDSLCPLQHVNLFNHQSLRLLGEQVGLREAQLPFWKWVGAGQLWNIPRQLNRNFRTPWKRWRKLGPYIWLQKPK
jgi:SAM-dependent methyltransferase